MQDISEKIMWLLKSGEESDEDPLASLIEDMIEIGVPEDVAEKVAKMLMDKYGKSDGMYEAMKSEKKPPLGTGERFDMLVKSMTKKGMPEERAKKIAAAIGRKKYGKAKFQKMAAKGKKRMSESAYGEMYIPKNR